MRGRELASSNESSHSSVPPESAACRAAWAALSAARQHARQATLDERAEIGFDRNGRLVSAASRVAWIRGRPGQGYDVGPDAPDETRAMLELYLPICAASVGAPVAVGHLGQSLDGQIATASGDSYYVTGPDNVLHLHRMRALADAVIVGAETVARDDPQLTVRHAAGANPVRVVLDPRQRLAGDRRVFADGLAATLLVAATERARVGCAETLTVPSTDGRLDLAALVARLHARGLNALFVEGGGRTVSAFLAAGLLDRLQIAVAPLVTGRGRPGLQLPPRDRIAECLRPAHRAFTMGEDVLFDCDLRAAGRPVEARTGVVRRIY